MLDLSKALRILKNEHLPDFAQRKLLVLLDFIDADTKATMSDQERDCYAVGFITGLVYSGSVSADTARILARIAGIEGATSLSAARMSVYEN